MKQKIYILGIGTTLLILLGIIFKVNHYPGAGILMTTGIIILLLAFIPSALINNYKNEGNRQNKLLYFVTWLTSFVVFSSMLFKIMHWSFGEYLVIVSLPFPFLVFLPVFLYTTSGSKKYSIIDITGVLFLLSAVSVLTALLALNA